MNPQLLRLLMQQSDTTNKASDLSKQTLNEIFGNKSAEADSLQEDSVKRLQEGGTFGKQGRRLIDIIKKAFEQGSRMKTEQEAVLPSQRNRPGVQYV